MTDQYRGHKIEKVYVYKDTQEQIRNNVSRPCGYCGRANTKEGHDGCLDTLPDVMNACCGHGEDNTAYVQFNNGFAIYGSQAVKYQNKHK